MNNLTKGQNGRKMIQTRYLDIEGPTNCYNNDIAPHWLEYNTIGPEIPTNRQSTTNRSRPVPHRCFRISVSPDTYLFLETLSHRDDQCSISDVYSITTPQFR